MMKKILLPAILLLTATCVFGQSDWSAVENIFGKKGTVTGDVFKITFPRWDLHVTIGDFSVAPGLALTSWIGMMKMGDQTMMMGDLVLLDSEEPAAVQNIVAAGLKITAIHNHLVNETPNIKYIHFSGEGDAVQLSNAIKSVLAKTATPMAPPNGTLITPAAPDWSKVKAILGTTGKENGSLLQYSFPRNETLRENGMQMPAAIGMATAINLQMDGNRVGTTGDFVLLADEVNPVVKSLTENGITVTAIHNHMLYDDPRLFMMHFWAVGDPEKIAMGLKAALDKTNCKH